MTVPTRRPVAILLRRRGVAGLGLATSASAVVLHAGHLVAVAAGPMAIAGAVGLICHIR